MQTTHTRFQVTGFNGQISSNSGLETVTGVSEDAIAIKPGYLVELGTSKNGVVLPANAFTTKELLGVVGLETNKEKKLDTGVIEYDDGDNMVVVRRGYMFLTIADTITKGEYLFSVHTTAGASELYEWRADLDTNKASQSPVIAMESGVDGDTIEVFVDITSGITLA